MFYHSESKKNEHDKYSKVPFQNYIIISDGTHHGAVNDISADLTVELQGDVHEMRRQLRQTMREMRSIYDERRLTT